MKVIKKVKIEPKPTPDGCWIFKLRLSDGEEIVFGTHEVVLRDLAVEIAERLFHDANKIDMVFACMYGE